MPPNKPILLRPVWVEKPKNKRHRQYIVEGEYTYNTFFGDFTIPNGFMTDLASTPRFIWNIFPPDGKYLEAAILHDYLYRTQKVKRKDADKIFFNEMKRMGVGYFTRQMIYNAVRLFGGGSYKIYKKGLKG